MALLRIDFKMAAPILKASGMDFDDKFFDRVMNGVDAFSAAIDKEDFQVLREKAYKTNYERRLLGAVSMDLAGVLEEDEDEIVFSDETASEEEEEGQVE